MSFFSTRYCSRKNAPVDLQIIHEEEDEPRPSCSSTSSLPRRRPVSPHDIRIAKTPDDDLDISLLSAPRPAPKPPGSASPSSESFEFPYPPRSTPSSSHYSLGVQSSPSSESSELPTPSSSDDEFLFTPAPKCILRRVSIRPLTIVKHDALPSMFSQTPSDFSEAESPSSDDLDSDEESDSEWYSRELSQVVTLRSALPANFPKTVKTETARPESLVASLHLGSVSPAFSVSSKSPSPQMDPAYPCRRLNRPSRPPPPPPRESLVPSPAISIDERLPKRSPPHTSIPVDFGFFSEDVSASDHEIEDEGEGDNVITYYVEAEDTHSASSDSCYSPPSHVGRFSISDLEAHLHISTKKDIASSKMLPLSLPATPIDLETDIANGLAELRVRRKADAPVDAEDLDTIPTPSPSITRSASLLARRQMRRNMVVSVPLVIDWNLSGEEEVAADLAREEVNHAPPTPELAEDAVPTTPSTYDDHELLFESNSPILRSRWSSSTLSSIREEQQSKGWGTSKLRLYFGSKKHRDHSSSSIPPATPNTPAKPKLDSKQKIRNKKRAVVVVGPPRSSVSSEPEPPSPTQSASGSKSYSYRSPGSKRHRHTMESSSSCSTSADVMIIGYGEGGVGVRRSDSTSTSCSSHATGSAASDALSSGSNRSSSSLKRKPIPVEMFLRA